jgi:catechol 2,3-dioxygenase-like lactoylglutathione lyase family enzyme
MGQVRPAEQEAEPLGKRDWRLLPGERPGRGGVACGKPWCVRDVDTAIAFYRERLGFDVDMHPAPGFAVLSRRDLPLLTEHARRWRRSRPAYARRAQTRAGGWNRIQLEVDDLADHVESLRKAGARFCNDIVTGRGGKQILLDDPSGNPIELFQPA